MKENSIEWITNDQTATVTLSQPKYINRVLKLKENDPDSVEIIASPETNNGFLVAHIRLNRVRIDTKRALSDEERTLLSERAKLNFGQKTSDK